MTKPMLQRPPRNSAFSLVEVVLALGVTSFALLSMVALIPLGLTEARQASDSTTEAQIVQFARNEIEMTPFTNLSSWSGVTSYFDNQGLPTTQGTAEQIYTVTYAVTNVALSTGGSTNATAVFIPPNSNTTNAMRVEVNIVNRTVPGLAATNIFPIVVPNAGF
jgi:uncharacterized protein (TIGR02598 family)